MSFELEVPKLDRICPGLVANNFNSRHGRNIYAWQERCRWCFWLRWSNASPPTPERICVLPLAARSWTVLRQHELREPTLLGASRTEPTDERVLGFGPLLLPHRL